MADESSDVDDFLKHYGVRGMKWGVRRNRDTREASGSGGKKGGSDADGPGKLASKPKSADYEESRTLAKKKPAELTNVELRRFNERLQLEKTYNQLKGEHKGPVQQAEQHVKRLVKLGKTAEDVYKLANGPMGKALNKTLKKSAKKMLK